ncbi:MAG: hypothetical protein IPL76_10550 [Gemmatimonadetes bacterium]|nr:hypothetical protein [Gemmatimonadota bacterium]
MNDREWLERVISDALTESLRDGRPVVACLADAVEKAQQAATAPAEPPVWPGLEGEGLMRVAKAFRTAHEAADARGFSHDDSSRAGYTAVAAYLWRAMVASLPDKSDLPSRIALAALADPYDGGGTCRDDYNARRAHIWTELAVRHGITNLADPYDGGAK